MSRVGILGGTFDPVHNGHLRLAEEAECRLDLDQILFIPAAIPPHKHKEISPYVLRRHWLELCLQGHTKWRISDLELERGGKSYTYDTLVALHQLHPQDELFFLTGADSLEAFTTWYRWQEILALCYFVVATRPGHPLVMPQEIAVEDQQYHNRGIIRLEIPALPVSSTEIRHLVQSEGVSEQLEALVPRQILEEVKQAWQ